MIKFTIFRVMPSPNTSSLLLVKESKELINKCH